MEDDEDQNMIRWRDTLDRVEIDRKLGSVTVASLAKRMAKDLRPIFESMDEAQPHEVVNYVGYAIDQLCWAHSPDDLTLARWIELARSAATREVQSW